MALSAFLLPTAAAPVLAENILEEVTVVAQRRSESLQEVPISIAAITGATLDSYGIDNSVLDLQLVTPGLQTTQVVSGFAPRIRAIGSSDSTPGNESSVSVYLDGVYLPGPASGLVSLSNIDRVEVLKGPQGTLFGRNTTGGVIHVITKDPSQETTGNLDVTVGNYDKTVFSGYATTGLSENVAADIAGRWEEQSDGWGNNNYDGKDAYTIKNKTARSKVLITPGERTRILLEGDYYEYNNHGAPFRLEVSSGYYDYNTDLNSVMDGDVWGASAKIEHDFDFATLVSISAYRDLNQSTTMDIDLGPTFFQHANFNSYGKSFSQELQLISPDSSELNWIVGLFYFDRKTAFDPGQQTGQVLQFISPTDPIDLFEIYNEQKTNSYAAYAQATYPWTQNTNLTLGIRYTQDEQELHSYTQVYPTSGDPPFVRSPTETDHQNADKPTYRAVIDHHFTPDIMAYVSFNTGFKSGYYNISGFPVGSADPEYLDAYEIGLKSEFFDSRLRLNAAAYYYDFTDFQSNYILQGQAVAINAGNATIKGLEMDLYAVPLANWNIRMGFNWMPTAKYDKFDPCPGPQNPPYVFPPGSASYDCSGSRMLNAPKWDVTVGTDYTIPTSVGDFNLSVAYNYMSEFPWDANFGIVPGYNTELFEEPSHSLVNLQAKWTSPSESYSAAVWWKNVTDEEYLVNGNQSSGSGEVGMPGAPETYGVTLGYQF